MTGFLLSTSEAVTFTGSPTVGAFYAWCRRHGVKPVRRQRVGRTTYAVWSSADLLQK